MTIDNFKIFSDHLRFIEKNDRYIVHILCRPKDIPPEDRVMGSNEHQRLIRTYYIDSMEYFRKKEEAIKILCRMNHARAYVLPQVRDNFKCLLYLGEKVLEAIRLGNSSIKPEHLMRSAYCEYHEGRNKRWILDLDADNMIEFVTNDDPVPHIEGREWSADTVLELVRNSLEKCGKNPNEAYLVPTRSGCHIVTPPFDLQTAFRKCSMMFEGVNKRCVAFSSKCEGKSGPVLGDVQGWLHKDGMSLLYYADDD